MKRHIAIPLLCVVLVAALSTSVFAAPHDSSVFPYPENNVSGRALVRFWTAGATVTEEDAIHGGYQMTFGDLWTGYFETGSFVDGYSPYTDLSFTLEIYVGGSLYIAVPDSDYTGVGDSALDAFYDSSGDYFVNFGDTVVNRYTAQSGGFAMDTITMPLKVKFLYFKNVAPGNYTVSVEGMFENAAVMCLGVYVSQGNAYGAIVDSFIGGSLSYSEALDEMLQFNESLDPIDSHEATVQALELQNMIAQLNAAASTVAAKIASNLDSKMESTINAYADDNLSLKDAMDSLSDDYTSALSDAQTVDEAQAVLAVYTANLKQLEAQSQVKMMIAFDDAMSDEEFQQIQDYYAAEGELINAFDVADFDAQLQFDNWFLLLPQKEAFDYKRFFDYLLNDSEIRHFIIIPLTMGLVSIIMGTRMRVRPSSGGKGDDD